MVIIDCWKVIRLMQHGYYASVGGAPEAYGSRRVCVCVYVFHAHFSATAKN